MTTSTDQSDPGKDNHEAIIAADDKAQAKGLAKAIGQQCDDIEKKRVEQTDKMRLLLLKLGRMAPTET